MATQISDIIVPEQFAEYVQQQTEEKSRIVQSGALQVDENLNSFLNGGGLTVNAPSFDDLANDEENVSTDDNTDSTPGKIQTVAEIAVRLSRNYSWSSRDLAAALAGTDPLGAIASRVATYRARRLQAAFIATMKGVFADNDAAPTGSEHIQGDLSHDITGVSYSAGVTDFSTQAFIEAALTMGDSMEDLSMVAMHSVVYSRMQINNLIDFIPDARGETNIATFLGRQVIVDDTMPQSGGVYETWLFGSGAARLGQGSPKVPVEVDRNPSKGNGAGEEILYNRWEWTIHPAGHAYVAASPANGGPSNAATAGNLAHADSWKRAFTERKQIKVARLLTRES